MQCALLSDRSVIIRDVHDTCNEKLSYRIRIVLRAAVSAKLLTAAAYTHNHFMALWILSGTTRVSWYQKKYSPTHTYRGHQSSLICFLHLLRSMASHHSHLCPLKCHLIFLSYRQVSLPCNILLRTQLLYNLPLTVNDIFSTLSFHSLSLLIRSSSVSAITARLSVYNNSCTSVQKSQLKSLQLEIVVESHLRVSELPLFDRLYITSY